MVTSYLEFILTWIGLQKVPLQLWLLFIFRRFSEKVIGEVSPWGWIYVDLIARLLSDMSIVYPHVQTISYTISIDSHNKLVRQPGEATKCSLPRPGTG